MTTSETKNDGPAVPSNALLDMRVGVPYIVTHDSVDMEFQCGDHIKLCPDGSIENIEAQGWIDAEDLPEATREMTVRIDTERLEKQRAKLTAKLAGMHI